VTDTLIAAPDRATVDGQRGPWWRHAVIYEVYVRSFADSDGDGIGDLEGIRRRVPYLAGLGVDALWLTPFYTSPMADGGYDIADYRDVDPTLGTLADFDALVAEAHAYGLRLIVDIVPNHTSAAHPWFREARAAPPGSPARDRYIFRAGRGEDGGQPPNDWESIFGGPAWTRVTGPDGAPGEWYLHLFDPSQPDLNWADPGVRAEFEDVLRFWLDRGVDGFRVDVAHGLVKAEGLPDVGVGGQAGLLGHQRLPYFDQDGVHDIYQRWRAILDAYPGERIAVAEAWAPDPDRLARYVRPDELHQAFNFHYLGTNWYAGELRRVIDESLAATGAVGAPTTWVLSNHDVRRHATRFGGGPAGLARARAAALLMLALPGSAYLYQGEELGLEQVDDLPDEVLQDPVWERSGRTDRGRDGCRVPMPWSGESAPYGFGTGHAWLPQPAAWAGLTVARQDAEHGSTLSMYRRALRARRAVAGELRWLDSPHPDVLVFARGGGFVCTVNVGDTTVDVDRPGALVLARTGDGALEVAGHGARLPAATAAWWTTEVT
jgi:alpha-glucosidase